MLKRKLWHKSLTTDVIQDAVERSLTDGDNPGFCQMCGYEQDGVEPDARNYECQNCSAEEVFGAEELMMEIA